MKIVFENTLKKDYIDLLPNFGVRIRPFEMFFGWLGFSVFLIN